MDDQIMLQIEKKKSFACTLGSESISLYGWSNDKFRRKDVLDLPYDHKWNKLRANTGAPLYYSWYERIRVDVPYK